MYLKTKIIGLIFTLSLFSGCGSSGSTFIDDNSSDENISDTSQNLEENVTQVGNIGDENISDTSQNLEENVTQVEENVTQTLKTLYLRGVAVDGEVQGATVSLGDKSVYTGESGEWEIQYSEDEIDFVLGEVIISGGTDVSTGEAFEGELRAYVNSDDIIVDNITGDKTIAVTPLTTIINAMVKTGLEEGVAEEKLANTLGIEKEILDKNPIELLKSGSQEEKIFASKSIKKALLVQKFSESMMKSISSSDAQDSEKFDNFDAIISAIAKKVIEANNSTEINSSSVFDSIFDSKDSLIESSANEIFSRDDNKNLDDIRERLQAAGEITQPLIIMINSFDENDLISDNPEDIHTLLEIKSKATEIVTLKIEDRVSLIPNSDLSLLSTIIEESRDMTDALIMVGGIDVISGKIEDAMKEINLSQMSIDASGFSSFIDDEIIESEAKIYSQFEELNISQETILKIAVEKDRFEREVSLEDINQSITPPTFNLYSTLQDFSDKDKNFPPIDLEAFQDHIVQIEDDIKLADIHIDERVEDIGDISLKELPEFTRPDEDPIIVDDREEPIQEDPIITDDRDEPIQEDPIIIDDREEPTQEDPIIIDDREEPTQEDPIITDDREDPTQEDPIITDDRDEPIQEDPIIVDDRDEPTQEDPIITDTGESNSALIPPPSVPTVQ